MGSQTGKIASRVYSPGVQFGHCAFCPSFPRRPDYVSATVITVSSCAGSSTRRLLNRFCTRWSPKRCHFSLPMGQSPTRPAGKAEESARSNVELCHFRRTILAGFLFLPAASHHPPAMLEKRHYRLLAPRQHKPIGPSAHRREMCAEESVCFGLGRATFNFILLPSGIRKPDSRSRRSLSGVAEGAASVWGSVLGANTHTHTHSLFLSVSNSQTHFSLGEWCWWWCWGASWCSRLRTTILRIGYFIAHLNCILKVIVIILSGSFLTQTPSSAEHVSVRSVCARSTVHSERRDDRHPNLTQTHTHMALESSSLLPAVCEMNQGLCDRARGAGPAEAERMKRRQNVCA